MVPALQDRQWIIWDRLVYRFQDPHYGDRIVLRHGTNLVVKRIIFLPGDRLPIVGGNLLLPDRIVPLTAAQQRRWRRHRRVPQDSYFVLGDNFARSLDSRDFGFVQRQNLLGKVRF